jgi:hypothetical protein
VLYSSSQRLGTFLEVLAQFRPHPAVVEGRQAIASTVDDELAGPGELDQSWLEKRRIAVGEMTGLFAAVGRSEWLAYLRDRVSIPEEHRGIYEVDAAGIRLELPPGITRRISRLVAEVTVEGLRVFQGIYYLSRHGDEIENWALFEPAEVRNKEVDEIGATDSDLLAVLERFNIRLIEV